MALFLAFLMFSTSTGYAMDVHYCGDEIKSIGFFGEAEACDMHKETTPEPSHACCHASAKKEEIKTCHKSGTSQLEKGECCHNETICIGVDGDFDSIKIVDGLNQESFVFTALFIYNSFAITTVKENRLDFLHYSPPTLTEDIAILHQVFII